MKSSLSPNYGIQDHMIKDYHRYMYLHFWMRNNLLVQL